MDLHAFILATTVLVASSSYAQNDTRNELVKAKGAGDMQLKGTSTEMYNGSTSEKAMVAYRQGLREHRAGELAAAKKSYAKAIKEDPQFVEAYDNLGQVHRQAGEYDLAIKNYQRSLEIYPQGQMARQNLALVYSITGDRVNAVSMYESLIEMLPDNAEGYFGLANMQLQEKQLDAALENALKALSIYEASGDAHLMDGYHLVGLVHYHANRYDEARPYILKAKDLGARIHQEVAKKVLGTEGAGKDTPRSADDYTALVPEVLLAYEWLYSTPVSAEPAKRKDLSAFLLQWIMGSPLVSIEIKEAIVPYTEQHECLMIYLGGYTTHVLRMNDNPVDANIYATEHVLEFYENNLTDLGKNKDLEKLLKMRKEGKLRAYIRANT